MCTAVANYVLVLNFNCIKQERRTLNLLFFAEQNNLLNKIIINVYRTIVDQIEYQEA